MKSKIFIWCFVLFSTVLFTLSSFGELNNRCVDDTLMLIQIASKDMDEMVLDLEGKGYDVLRGSQTADTIDVIVNAGELELLRKMGYDLIVLEKSSPFAEILKDRKNLDPALKGVPEGYKELDAIIEEMKMIAAENSEIAELVDLTAKYNVAPTFEGRHIYAMKISDEVEEDENEPAVLIVSTHHAREIITPVIALNAIREFTNGYGRDDRIKDVIDDHEIWIAPVWNPDGYHHVFAVNNMWRKNRRPFGEHFGVDLNRNYPHQWSGDCSGSLNPAKNTFKGDVPGSEAETKTMIAFTEDQQFKLVLDFHSTGREVLFQYSKCDSHPHDAWTKAIAEEMVKRCDYKRVRFPSASGEHYHYQRAKGAMAFLVETYIRQPSEPGYGFQPPFPKAVAEAKRVWPGILWFCTLEPSIAGKVKDANSENTIANARIEFPDVEFKANENFQSGPNGNYFGFLPPELFAIRVSADGYLTHEVMVDLTDDFTVEKNIYLVPLPEPALRP